MLALKSAGVTLPASYSWALGRNTLMASPSGLKASSTLVWKALASSDAVTVVVLDGVAPESSSPPLFAATRPIRPAATSTAPPMAAATFSPS